MFFCLSQKAISLSITLKLSDFLETSPFTATDEWDGGGGLIVKCGQTNHKGREMDDDVQTKDATYTHCTHLQRANDCFCYSETTSQDKSDIFLPDSITTWQFTGISLSRTHGENSVITISSKSQLDLT